MSRYIDADALIEDLDTVNPVYKEMIEWAKRVVKAQPTADVVKIVRCKDCAYWQQNTVRQNSNDAGWWNEALCERHTIYGNEPHEAWVDADWFCADAEERR